MRGAVRRPGLPGTACWTLLSWLVSAVSDLLSQVFFLSSGCSFTLLKGSHRVQHSARPCTSTLLDRLFFASFFGPRFLSILSPFLPPFCLPKSTQNRKISGKNGVQIRLCFPIAFLMDFGLLLDGPNLQKSLFYCNKTMIFAKSASSSGDSPGTGFGLQNPSQNQ